MTAKERYFVFWDMDTLQYEDVESEYAETLIANKQLKAVGIISKNGKKYIKYILVK